MTPEHTETSTAETSSAEPSTAAHNVTSTATPYRWGRLATDDVTAWASLTNVLADVDETEEFYEPEDLAEELGESGLDPALDTWAVWDGQQMVAFGMVRVAVHLDHDGRVRCYLGGGVHPEHRGRGIGRQLMDDMERRGAQLAAERHPGRPAFWRADGGLEGSSVRALLEHRGYAIVRYFNQMTRALPGQPLRAEGTKVTLEAPPGIRLASPDDSMEEALRVSHNEAFRDHWGSTEQSAEGWHDHWTSRSSRPALSSLAIDGAGRPLAYVMCGQWVDRELYVNLVGTVPDARGRGLAMACLGRTIELASAAGDYNRIELHVDSVSPTGATRLYERLGFSVKKTFASYQRDIT